MALKYIPIPAFLLLFILAALSNANAQSYSRQLKKADSLYFSKDYSNAVRRYRETLKDTSKNGMAWNRLGFSYYNLGNMDAAMAAYKNALKYSNIVPLRASVFSRLARVNALSNNKMDALANIDSALNYGYLSYFELDTLKDFNTIRSDPGFKELRTKIFNSAYPCMTNAQAREFDFWVGKWDVYVTDTKNCVGHSVVQIVPGGCALLENWSSNSIIDNGKSLNFIDPATNKWRQTWVDNGGLQEFVNGTYQDGAMRFTFEKIDSQNHKLTGRFMFYNQGPNQVRQFNETSADNGKTWVTNYDFTYIRK